MEILFTVNFLIILFISIFIGIKALKLNKNKFLGKNINYFFIIIFSYVILGLFFLLWSFNILDYSKLDFLILYSIVIIIHVLIFFKLSYALNKNKKVNYFILTYLFCLLILFYNFFYFLNFFLITSFLLILIISLNLSFNIDGFKRAGIFLVYYSIFSLFLQFLSLFFIIDISYFIAISFILLFFSTYFFLNSFKKTVLNDKKVSNSKKSYFMIFFKSFIFIIAISNFIFIGTIGIHEIGHFTLSKFYSCENTKIIYSGDSPYTEALCKSPTVHKTLLFGGFLPFLVGFFFFIFGGRLLKHIGILVIGFNLVLLYEDFIELGLSSNIVILFTLAGVCFIIFGVMILARSCMQEYSNII